MRAILLAAGRGRRLEASGWTQPKCLLPFGDTTILDNMLAALTSHGVRDVTMVVGYMQDLVRARVAAHDLRVDWVENPDYATTNTINSLWRARESMAGDFLYFNADVLFDGRVVERLLAASGSRVAVDKKRCAEEEVKVVLDGTGRVTRIGKALDPSTCAGEFIGIGKFLAAMNGDFVEALRARNARGETNMFFEAALDDVLGAHVVREVDVSDLASIEIDFPEDLAAARAEVAPRLAADRRDAAASGGAGDAHRTAGAKRDAERRDGEGRM